MTIPDPPGESRASGLASEVMRTRIATRTRGASILLGGALLIVPLAGCSGNESADSAATAEATDTESAPADGTGATESGSTETEAGDGTGAAGGGTDTGTESEVDCSGTSCTVTLSGDGAEAEILGTTVVLGGVQDGQATFRIGDQETTCGQGDRASAGPLTLECTSVTGDTVTMTASLG